MSEWPSGLRRQTQGVISFSVGEVSGSPHGGVGSNPTSDNVSFTIGSVVETAHIIFFSVYYASDLMPMI